MNDPALIKQSFGDNLNIAYGAISSPDLSYLCKMEKPTNGNAHWIKTRRVAGNRNSSGAFIPNVAQVTKTMEVSTIQDFERLSSSERTWAKFLELRNPDMERDEWYTLSEPYTIRIGDHWDKIEEVVTANDPTHQDMVDLAQARFLAHQYQIINAITASTTTRKVGSTTSQVSLGSFNEIETARDGYIDVTLDFPTIRGKANLNNINGLTPVYLLVHTNDATTMIQQNWEKIYNKDFVTGEQLKTGNNIPELNGVRVIQTPLIEQGTFYAVVQGAITRVPYEAYTSGMWQNDGMQGIFEFWGRESIDTKRTDDFGVFHGQIKNASGAAVSLSIQAGYAYGTGSLVTSMETWNAITKGSLKVEVDGEDYSLTDMNFSSAENLNDVATIIQTALQGAGANGATVLYDESNGRMKIVSGTVGASSKVDDIKAGSTASSNVNIKTTLGFGSFKSVLGA